MFSGLKKIIVRKYPRINYYVKRVLRPVYLIWLEYRFAKQHKIDLKQLYGKIFDESGKNFRRDPYELKCDGFKSSLYKMPVKVNNLIMEGTKRFSNSLIQLCNLLLVGKHLGVKQIFLPDSLWYVNDSFTIGDIQFSQLKSCMKLPEGISLSGKFFFLQTLRPVIKPQAESRFELLAQYKPHISIGNLSEFPEFDLAIHIRSGDVFSVGGGHPDYGQPPLAYYNKILNNFRFESIAIVYEDMANPVIPHVVRHAKEVCKNVSEFSGELKSDLAILLNAKNVVAGIGTFMQGVVAISDRICNVFCFHEGFEDWGSPVNVVDVVDSSGKFVSNVMSNNWRNTQEQIDWMMNYPESSLEIIGGMMDATH